jgi:branched-chain amino acid aminotransferase
MTDHMLLATYDPELGWSDPVIQPYQPLQLDPASSCFQYCPNVFEGMKVSDCIDCRVKWSTETCSKAYMGPDGVPRLFRPELNMKRLKTSVERVALPVSLQLASRHPFNKLFSKDF